MSALWTILKGISDNLDLGELQILPYVPNGPAQMPVDDCMVLHAENVGIRQLWEGWYAGADLILRLVKS